jgi:hypothetical protein
LIGHGSWLRRSDFVDRCLEVNHGLGGETVLAGVDWAAAVAALESGELACSGSEGRLLRIAASIAVGVPLDLGEALTGLDEANLALVTEAVVLAGGWRR